ncbi:putative glutamate receptor [Calliopsis andreniformis]|uniref:putative glutamate receptor n=1 Tax=Calliopsis andreniformis TaxID=337506 RepID=UPI003FCE97ED
MKKLLLLIVIQNFLMPVQSVNGLIWNKRSGEFVPIFSVPTFAVMNELLLNHSRQEEIHNFQGRIVRLSYYEMNNLLKSAADGTMVTGVIGEIWNTLSELLNFTLVPNRTDENTLGRLNSDGVYINGLLQHLQRNETDVVPRVEAYNKRIIAGQFTIPLWKSRCQYYIRREVTHIPTWMLKLFSRKVWYAVLMTYFLLSICSYLTDAVASKIIHKKAKVTLNDHLFYNLGVICSQCYLPSNLSKSSRMVEVWSGIFSVLIKAAFGALLIGYMTQIVIKPPFHDMHSLMHNTKYNIVVLDGSFPSVVLKANVNIFKTTIQANRIVHLHSVENVYKTGCSKNLFTIVDSEDIKKSRGLYFCRLNPVGIPFVNSWITSGISWNFTFKRSLDIGILRLHEVGIIKLLKHRWIETKNAEYNTESNTTEPIIMEQTYFIFLILFYGLLISLAILIVENVIFYCNNE